VRVDPVSALAGYARSIVLATSLDGKLAPPPDDLDFEAPRAALVLAAPGRAAALAITAGRDARVPPVAGMRDPAQRARILHALANHELQAIELFAWAVLAFADAPAAFHRGLVAVLADEQRHFALYRARLHALGCRFGDHPVTGHFWNKLDHLATPLGFVATMGLTFENANLDFCGDYERAARACGDVATADALAQVHADEIRHVRFGYVWLRRLAAGESAWQAYQRVVRYPLGARRARGKAFDRDARVRAGLDDEFIAGLEAAHAVRPSGAAR
jgi:uncharacterized ferritin-like protein (DUF455 family)